MKVNGRFPVLRRELSSALVLALRNTFFSRFPSLHTRRFPSYDEDKSIRHCLCILSCLSTCFGRTDRVLHCTSHRKDEPVVHAESEEVMRCARCIFGGNRRRPRCRCCFTQKATYVQLLAWFTCAYLNTVFD